jgi:hypothetical protein
MQKYTINFSAYEVNNIDFDSGRTNPIAYFTNVHDAMKCRELKNDGSRTFKKTTVNINYAVYDSFNEYVDKAHDSKRQIALSKLTAEEIELLGL